MKQSAAVCTEFPPICIAIKIYSAIIFQCIREQFAFGVFWDGLISISSHYQLLEGDINWKESKEQISMKFISRTIRSFKGMFSWQLKKNNSNWKFIKQYTKWIWIPFKLVPQTNIFIRGMFLSIFTQKKTIVEQTFVFYHISFDFVILSKAFRHRRWKHKQLPSRLQSLELKSSCRKYIFLHGSLNVVKRTSADERKAAKANSLWTSLQRH